MGDRVTPLEGMLALARVEHPEWWRAWNWIEDHSEMLELPEAITDGNASEEASK